MPGDFVFDHAIFRGVFLVTENFGQGAFLKGTVTKIKLALVNGLLADMRELRQVIIKEFVSLVSFRQALAKRVIRTDDHASEDRAMLERCFANGKFIVETGKAESAGATKGRSAGAAGGGVDLANVKHDTLRAEEFRPILGATINAINALQHLVIPIPGTGKSFVETLFSEGHAKIVNVGHSDVGKIGFEVPLRNCLLTSNRGTRNAIKLTDRISRRTSIGNQMRIEEISPSFQRGEIPDAGRIRGIGVSQIANAKDRSIAIQKASRNSGGVALRPRQSGTEIAMERGDAS